MRPTGTSPPITARACASTLTWTTGCNNGWFLLRLSVHDPVLPLNVESDVPGGVRTMLSKLLSVLDGIEDIDISPIRAYLSKN